MDSANTYKLWYIQPIPRHIFILATEEVENFNWSEDPEIETRNPCQNCLLEAWSEFWVLRVPSDVGILQKNVLTNNTRYNVMNNLIMFCVSSFHLIPHVLSNLKLIVVLLPKMLTHNQLQIWQMLTRETHEMANLSTMQEKKLYYSF